MDGQLLPGRRGGSCAPPKLSLDQIAYRLDGFLAIEDFATPAPWRELSERAMEIVDAFEPTVPENGAHNAGSVALICAGTSARSGSASRRIHG